MKLRNQLLALVCLLVFIAFGVVFFKTWVVQKPFGIILFVTDGLSTNTVTAARLYEGGADYRLTLEKFPRLALVSNHSNDYAVPDAAAAATAIATGERVNNRAIGVDPKGRSLESLLVAARKAGRATGLVTTGNLTDATPAAFYAHTTDAQDAAAIAEQFLGDSQVDLALGGGLQYFLPEGEGGVRKDGRNLWLELRSKGYSLISNKAELENTPAFLTGPLVGIFSPKELADSNQKEIGGVQPSLSDMVRRGIEFLQGKVGGYLLVVDCALVAKNAGMNNGEKTLIDVIDFDRALKTAQRYAGENALIIAVGRHDIGGLSLNGYPLRGDHGVSLLGTNTAGYPAITWSTGPNGPMPPEEVASEGGSGATAKREEKSEPAAFYTPHGVPTARDMIMIGTGPGSEPINGFLDHTDVFKIIKLSL